jgi:hypothetical protein
LPLKIAIFPLNIVIFHSYVSLPEGKWPQRCGFPCTMFDCREAQKQLPEGADEKIQDSEKKRTKYYNII